MAALDRDILVALAGNHAWPSISLYMPIQPVGSIRIEDRVRFKNLVRQAFDQLSAQGMRGADADRLLAEARALQDDDNFWRGASKGLAVFVTPSSTQSIRFDTTLPEQCVVGDRFYLRPIVAAQHVDHTFYALALDKNRTRLMKGDESTIEEVPLPFGTPLTFEEATKYDDVQEPSMTTNSFGARGSSRSAQRGVSVFAGHGGEKDAADYQSANYARLIERGVAEVLKNEDIPLVIMGVERQLADYRILNTYPHLKADVFGASDYLTPQQIRQMALGALATHFDQVIEANLRELVEAEGSPLASHDPAEIVAAAATGRVKALFFDESMGPFGQFDRDTLQVTRLCDDMPRLLREQQDTGQATEQACGWDLIDLAAAETALHGGELHAFVGENAPVEGVAAVFRY